MPFTPSRSESTRAGARVRLRLVAFVLFGLVAASALASCGTPKCTVKGCGFDSNF